MRPSGTSRLLALSIGTAGILTFFYPFVTIDLPVAGLTRWSLFDIVLQMYSGVLPPPVCERCDEAVVRTLLALPFMVTVEYLFMMVAGVALCSRKSRKVVVWIAVVGISNGLWEERIGARLDFRETFFGMSGRGHVHYGGLVAAHLVVMVALLLTSFDLRDKESEEAQRGRPLSVKPRDPPFVEAEILQDNEDHDDTPHLPPRLGE